MFYFIFILIYSFFPNFIFSEIIKKSESKIDYFQQYEVTSSEIEKSLSLLKNLKESVRIEALNSLHRIVLDDQKYRKEVIDIIATHIRTKTNEKEYQEIYREKPSKEIEISMNILFKGEESLNRKKNGNSRRSYFFGLITYNNSGSSEKDESIEGNSIDLKNTYLVGINLEDINCKGVDFSLSNFKKAKGSDVNFYKVNFREANLEGVRFRDLNCHGVNFEQTILEKSYIIDANFHETNFPSTNLKGSDLKDVNFHEVNFQQAILEGSKIIDANFHRVNFSSANLKKINFNNVNFYGSNFNDTNLKGAKFKNINLQGTIFND